MVNQKSADYLLHKTRTQLLGRHPFYGYMACRLKLRVDENQPTCATDGVHLFYNPAFIESLTNTQIMACWAHEVHHPLQGHNWRMGDRNPLAWNISCDQSINPRLKDAGFDLIPDAVYPTQECWDDSAENHYKRIKITKIKVGGCGGCSGVRPYPGANGKATPAEQSQAQAEWEITVLNAANFARAAGNLPADIERLIGQITAPKVAWTDVLRRFMTATAKNDYRMMPPNRRYVHQGLYLPSLRSEGASEMALFIDGSGSTSEVFPQFISEFASILSDVRPERLHVVVWDTQAHYYKVFDRGEELPTVETLSREMRAGGGTVFTDCFDWFAENSGIVPAALIFLTDMEVGGWPENPGYPVLWAATTDLDSPYGEIVRVKV